MPPVLEEFTFETALMQNGISSEIAKFLNES